MKNINLENKEKEVKDEIDRINDKDTLREMLTFIVNDKGRAEAEDGYHDDLVMALAITYYIRTQQDMKKTDRNSIHKDLQEELDRVFGINENHIEEDYGDDIVPF